MEQQNQAGQAYRDHTLEWNTTSKNPIDLLMQVMACSKHSFNYGEALKVQFKDRVKKGTDLLLEHSRGWEKQTRRQYEGRHRSA